MADALQELRRAAEAVAHCREDLQRRQLEDLVRNLSCERVVG
eukprot:CAMPEP_0173215304 /NCGR_PEP_ID=MMETSP1141-20130122/26429_1 /TAXON_ID=483371 /ORGANISM="non described non described, Strain CCMP2298" /LENGTH=41 /DNA_ID= /DNA_START= /DNA_END= /DNA_ORIENTATION=